MQCALCRQPRVPPAPPPVLAAGQPALHLPRRDPGPAGARAGDQSQLAVRSRDTCSPPIGQPPLLLLTSSTQLATFALVWYTVFYTRLGALPRQKYVLPALLLAQDLQRLCMN